MRKIPVIISFVLITPEAMNGLWADWTGWGMASRIRMKKVGNLI